MRRALPKLPHKRVLELLDYDPTVGVFVRKTGSYKGRSAGSVDNSGALNVYLDGWHVKATRLAWFYVTGDWPAEEVGTKNGNKLDVRFENLRLDPRVKHGHTPYWGKASRTYTTWAGMVQRCTNPNCKHWHRYGGRGIKVCDRWLNSFAHFLEDMGEKPKGLTLDRINNDGNYEPSNCRWTDSLTQARNSTITRNVTAFGKTQGLGAWAKEVGISIGVLAQRLDSGLDPETAFSMKRWYRPSSLKREQSGLRGITQTHHKSKPWRASFSHDGTFYHVGFFESPETAHAAYMEARQQLGISP